MTGTYTEILDVVVPSSAKVGDIVTAEVKVKNLHSAPVYITVTGDVDGSVLYFGGLYHTVAAGVTQSFYDTFIMPSNGVRLYAFSFYYGDDGQWKEDDNSYADIALTTEEVTLTGIFTKADGQVQISDPNTGQWVLTPPTLEPGQATIMRVEVQNTSSVYADLCVTSKWVTKYGEITNESQYVYNVEPNGYRTVEIIQTVPEIGDCSAENSCWLYVKEAGAVNWPIDYNDAKSYNWCQVQTEEPEPEPGEETGEVIGVTVDWQSYTGLVPPAQIEKSGTFEVHFDVKNTYTESLKLAGQVVVTKPSGEKFSTEIVEEFGLTGAGELHHFEFNICDVDEIGTWTGAVKLYAYGKLLDTWSGDLLVVGEVTEAPGIIDIIVMIGPLLTLGLLVGIMPMLKGEK